MLEDIANETKKPTRFCSRRRAPPPTTAAFLPFTGIFGQDPRSRKLPIPLAALWVRELRPCSGTAGQETPAPSLPLYAEELARHLFVGRFCCETEKASPGGLVKNAVEFAWIFLEQVTIFKKLHKNFMPNFTHNFVTNFAQNFTQNFTTNYAQNFTQNFATNFAENFTLKTSPTT